MSAAQRLRAAVPPIAVVALVGDGLVGFRTVYAGPWYLVAGAAGIALGAVVVLAARRLGLGLLPSALLLVVGYFLIGTTAALSGGRPDGAVLSLTSIRTLATGAVECWHRLVTAEVPAAPEGVLVLPPLLLCAAATAAALALLPRTVAGTLAVAVLPLIGSIALGTDLAVLPLAQGVVLVGSALLLLAARPRGTARAQRFRLTGSQDAPAAARRVLPAVAVLATACCVGGAALAAVPAAHRANIRDAVQPPIDVSDLPTPLTLFRRWVGTDEKTALFSVSGAKQGAFVPLAVLDTYDGTSYGVAGTASGSGAFRTAAAAVRPALTVRVLGLSGVWVPGSAEASRVTGPAGRRIGLNAGTRSVVVPAGVRTGDVYRIDLDAAPPAAATGRADAAQPGTPTAVADRLTDFLGNARTPAAKLAALAKGLRLGYYSDGQAGQARSLPGHGAARITTLLTPSRLVGDDEQYAVAMALMTNQLGYPARVVMGFEVPKGDGAVVVRGGDVHARVQVAVDGVWKDFDPTPPKDRTTQDSAPQPKPKPVPNVQQPPPPVRTTEDSTPDSGLRLAAKKADDSHGAPAWLPTVMTVGAGGAGAAAVLLAPVAAVAGARARRRRRRLRARRPADRIAGGWSEVVDRAAGLGMATTSADTRRERAESLDARYGVPAVALAARADAQVFGQAEPSDDDARRFWAEVDELTRGMGRSATRWTRLKDRYGVGGVRRRSSRTRGGSA